MDQAYPKGRADVQVRVVDGETLILDRREGVIHHLNLTASYIWARCDGHTSVAAIGQQLAEAFDIDPLRVAQDVTGLVDQLRQLRLLDLPPTQSNDPEARR